MNNLFLRNLETLQKNLLRTFALMAGRHAPFWMHDSTFLSFKKLYPIFADGCWWAKPNCKGFVETEGDLSWWVVNKHFNRILILSILDIIFLVSLVWQEPGASHWRDSEGAARRRRDRRSLLEEASVIFITIIMITINEEALCVLSWKRLGWK